MYVLRPENLTPWWDSNLGSSVLEADAMTTMTRRKRHTLRRNNIQITNSIIAIVGKKLSSLKII
jgi:hypothetical protein